MSTQDKNRQEENEKRHDKHEQNENNRSGSGNVGDTPDMKTREGFENINAASGDSQDNVISSEHSKAANERHSRKRGEPLTGASPKGI